MIDKRKWIKYGLWTFLTIFALMNAVALFHSYKFTHFTDSKIEKTKAPEKLTAGQKIRTLVFGVSNPRPKNIVGPTMDYETIKLKSNREIEGWSIKTDNPKGTVILFHGFGGKKSSMLDKSDIFLKLGYNTFLVDFMGSGGSEGNQTTIGFLEAEQVKTCFDFLTEKGEKNIYLFGTSMGAVAIMKSIYDYQLQTKGIIIECPFGSMYQTVCTRFKAMNAPTFPMAGLLVFWGGVQNGFWAFGHSPTEYANKINCPTLLLYGAKDEKVSRREIDGIYKNLSGAKSLIIYPEAGHENYLSKYQDKWTKDIQDFLKMIKQTKPMGKPLDSKIHLTKPNQ
ncbi:MULTISPECIES: alpha/beta hydrolase [Flavobacteriaceae]|uniref:alpha/beta hydrolase n=1 Tax=Flavobacteriaceae TaxID=49546 RepID=UPI00234B532F|nr:alpha/beta hydrolase [Muricauda sp. SP22]MDC6363651.1 alpha/beta hydrolase [Muricauda sp. SP22]